MRIYVASPFFCAWDNIIRNKMIKAIKESYPKAKIFYPDRTVASKLFSLFHTTKLAKEIYKIDTQEVNKADLIVFPEYTADLGTLFEVGYAIGLNKPFARYNYFTNTITDITESARSMAKEVIVKAFSTKNELVVDCSKPICAIAVGCLIAKQFYNFKYYLPSKWADNIMFKYSGIERKVEDGERINNQVL